MTTENNNKLIAEFMDALTIDMNGVIKEDLKDFNYNKDWNWLMQVVEKIEGLSNQKEVINWSRQNKNIYDFKLTESKIEAVYNACVEFIKWYNEQNLSINNK